MVLYRSGGIVLDLDQLLLLSNAAVIDESFLEVVENSTAPALLILDTAQRLTNACLAAPPRHPFSFLWVQTLLLRCLTLRGVDEQWTGPYDGGESLPSALLHFGKQSHSITNISAYALQAGFWIQPMTRDAAVRIMDAATLPWLHIQTPPSVELPRQAESIWGNTDTCLMRIYQIHESHHRMDRDKSLLPRKEER